MPIALTRRKLLRAGVSMLALGGTMPRSFGLPRGGSAAPSGSLSAQVVVPSGTYAGTYNFSTAGGTNQTVTTMQPYVDPGLSSQGVASQFIVQRTMVVNSTLPLMRVFFEQDTAGTQNFQSFICEWGDPLNATAVDLAAGYVLTISANGTTVYTSPAIGTSGSIAGHPWLTGYRVSCVGGGSWGPGVTRPVTRSVAQLTAANLLPVFSASTPQGSLTGSATPVPSAETYQILGLSGINGALNTTGDWNYIGLFTNWQAYYIVTGNGLSTVFAVAEAARSWNMVLRDPTTLAPMDMVNTYPHASMDSGSPLIPITNYLYPYGTGQGVAYEEGHSPQYTYLPFLLTGDPYYLESLQFQMNRDLMEPGWPGRYNNQGRYVAWPLRTCIMATVATPASVPSWLLSSAQVGAVLTAYGSAIANQTTGSGASDMWTGVGVYLNSTADPGQNSGALWENGYLTITANWATILNTAGVISVPTGILTLATGSTAFQQAQTSSTAGWNNAYPGDVYDCPYGAVVTLAAAGNVGDTTLTVNSSCAQAFTNGGWIASTATPQQLFGLYTTPFEIYNFLNAKTVTVTGGVGTTTWTLSAPLANAMANGSTVQGPNFTTITSFWNFLALAGGFNAPPGSLAPGTNTASFVYLNIMGASLRIGKQASISGTDPTYINGIVVYSAIGNTGEACDYKWMFEA